jgi:hypothetical protein
MILTVTTPLAEHPDVQSAIELLAAWIEAQIHYRETPGLAIGIVHDQTVIWGRGFGWADVERRVPATVDTIYRIGSITKLFTATAILILRDAGKLALDEPITTYLPWFAMKSAPRTPGRLRYATCSPTRRGCRARPRSRTGPMRSFRASRRSAHGCRCRSVPCPPRVDGNIPI